MAELIWSDEANNDLVEIFEHVADDSVYFAEQLIESINERCQTLLAQPFIGRPFRGDIAKRVVLSGKYRIFYTTRLLPDIEVIRVIHSSRENY